MSIADDWAPPRCRHDQIILACPDEECPEQNAYLAENDNRMAEWHQSQEEQALQAIRELAGLFPTCRACGMTVFSYEQLDVLGQCETCAGGVA